MGVVKIERRRGDHRILTAVDVTGHAGVDGRGAPVAPSLGSIEQGRTVI
jgi:hypothetical protein